MENSYMCRRWRAKTGISLWSWEKYPLKYDHFEPPYIWKFTNHFCVRVAQHEKNTITPFHSFSKTGISMAYSYIPLWIYM